MKVIIRDEKDAYDRITRNLSYLEIERMQLFANMLAINMRLEGVVDSFPAAEDYIDSLTSFTADLIKENNKEVKVYKKMLRYLQLMITNDTYEYYTDSYYYDYFNEVIDALETSKESRGVKNSVFNYSIAIGVRNRAESITIKSNYDVNKPVISDDLFEDMLKRIPSR